MEAIIFIGIQGSGKSTFFRHRFFDTHVRINLDMLKTRNREKLLLQACLEGKQPFVVDNTNPVAEDRTLYIKCSKQHGFRVIGYYFRSNASECLARNSLRSERAAIPAKGLLGTYKRLQLPTWDEGFDELYYVSIENDLSFLVKDWQNEIR